MIIHNFALLSVLFKMYKVMKHLFAFLFLSGYVDVDDFKYHCDEK